MFSEISEEVPRSDVHPVVVFHRLFVVFIQEAIHLGSRRNLIFTVPASGQHREGNN